MAQRTVMLFLALLLLIITGCSGNADADNTSITANVNAEANIEANAEIDLSTLAPVLDAQTVAAIKDHADVLLIDVREQVEYDAGHIPGITLIPMGEVPGRLAEIPKDKTVIVTCRSGNRSSQVASYLQEQGFTNIHDLQGGIIAWQQAGLPIEQ